MHVHVRDVSSRVDGSYYVVNYTFDPLLPLLGNLKRVQIMPLQHEPPFYLNFAERGYRNEGRRIQQLLASKKAIVLSIDQRNIPGYETVLVKPWSKDVPWFWGKKLYISVPDTEATRLTSAQAGSH